MSTPDPVSPNIYLIGLMGAGKTAVGQALARQLGCPFVDSDQEIVARTGVSIATIFDIEGESRFRQRESQVIADLTQRSGIILATGGGAILDAGNRQILHERGWVVYLRQRPETLHQRTRKNSRQRPMLDTDDPLARLRELYAQRDPLYRETAHLILDAPHQGIVGICQQVLNHFALLT